MSARLLIDGYCEPVENMARDEALLKACDGGEDGFPVLRFYQWSIPTLSLGAKERLQEAADIKSCDSLSIEIVRRATGGRAVLHDQELTYSIIAPLKQPPFDGSVVESYQAIAEAIRSAISLVGIDLELTAASRKISPRTSTSSIDKSKKKVRTAQHMPCFAAPSRYELAYNGKKVVGSAQRRFRNAVLQHGSILFQSEVEKLSAATGAGTEQTQILKNSMIGLEEILDYKISTDDLIEHLTNSLEKVFMVKLNRSAFSPVEENLLISTRSNVSARISRT